MEEMIRDFNIDRLLEKDGSDLTPFVAWSPDGLDDPGSCRLVYIGRLHRMMHRYPNSREALDYELFRILVGGGQPMFGDGHSFKSVRDFLIAQDERFKDKQFIAV